jgi:NADP-dependent 3-hydroxy acid dehydrogenase YdfG
MLHTNVTAVAVITKVLVKGMIERNFGHIINISSVAGHEAYGGVCVCVCVWGGGKGFHHMSRVLRVAVK